MIAEGNKDGSYKTVKRCDGLTNISNALGEMRSNILVNGGYSYFISGANLYRMDINMVSTSLGAVGGLDQGQILSNSVPGNNQILVLNGSGDGYIYNNSGLVQITDPDFYPTTSGTVLNERFWFVRDGTNEFFASDISDGFSYNPLSFASAEESPDNCVSIIAKRSSLWILNSTTTEFWQSYDDPTLPVRKVRSSTLERGIRAPRSLAELGEYFIFLADDLTVRLVQGNSMSTISDLEFNLKVRGNGTTTSPGFTATEDAIGFFVDSPTHKIYYITFPSEGYTWGYDLSTGMSHIRKTESSNSWRARYSAVFDDKVIMGDSSTNDIWLLDPDAKTEGGAIMRCSILTPGISFDTNVTIPLIELDLEVGQVEDPSISPKVMIVYTKDGGYTWVNHSDLSIGTKGDYRKRVPMRNFGRLVRGKDFAIELVVTDPVRFQVYGAFMPMSRSI
jgi:hypothetical protein